MPANYVSPDVKSTLTPDEIRQRYRDTSLVVFKDHQLNRVRQVRESEREIIYLSFGANRRVMTYTNNGNDPVIVHRSAANAVAVQRNRRSMFSSQILRMYNKPNENCTIS